MKLYLNGDERDVPAGLTVSGLLDHLGLDPRLVVVERNLTILDKDLYESTGLQSDDRLELVQFVGGG